MPFLSGDDKHGETLTTKLFEKNGGGLGFQGKNSMLPTQQGPALKRSAHESRPKYNAVQDSINFKGESLSKYPAEKTYV